MRHAAKAFGAVQAIADGSIELYSGEAHALVGENGAGKSTMVKILAGVHQLDSGTLLMDGEPTTLHGPAAAKQAGIAVIYQEPTLFPDLTVAENIFMGRQPLRAGRRIDARAMRAQAAEIFGRLGVPLDPARICRGLSIADQQIVEIGKALSLKARVIVMDEPTAALSAWRWPGSSRSCARCGPRAPPCSSSRTGSRRCSRSASGSPSCATAGRCSPGNWQA